MAQTPFSNSNSNRKSSSETTTSTKPCSVDATDDTGRGAADVTGFDSRVPPDAAIPLKRATGSAPAAVPVPKLGPDPVLLSRKEVDALYDTFEAVAKALKTLQVDWIVTGGTLLGAIRQHSLLFCDDDIDIAIIDYNHDDNNNLSSPSSYDKVRHHLQRLLNEQQQQEEQYNNNNIASAVVPKFQYQIRPWEGGDRIRPTHVNTVFLDLFVLRRFDSWPDFVQLISQKTNGQSQSPDYVESLVQTVRQALLASDTTAQDSATGSQSMTLPRCPFWHFETRKAVEMWPKEVYRPCELFPLNRTLKFGPMADIPGPRMPLRLLQRAFGADCFEVYYQSVSHGSSKIIPNLQQQEPQKSITKATTNLDLQQQHLPPHTLAGGTWEGGSKVPLQDKHYIPMQPTRRASRRFTLHNKQQLMQYLAQQSALEQSWFAQQQATNTTSGQVAQEPAAENVSRSNNDQSGQCLTGFPSYNKYSCTSSPKNSANETTSTTVQSTTESGARPRCTVYMDGVFDMFHLGHLKAIQQCMELGDRVILGVTGDEDAAGYKRPPIVPQEERTAIVAALQGVDQVICPCPLVVTDEFMDQHGIDLVVHGFANDEDVVKQADFFAAPLQRNQFQRIGYYPHVSTTDRIRYIQTLKDGDDDGVKRKGDGNGSIEVGGENSTCNSSNGLIDAGHPVTSVEVGLGAGGCNENLAQQQERYVRASPKQSGQQFKKEWFGAALAKATNYAPFLPTDPFPLSLRTIMEPHLEKARKNRSKALEEYAKTFMPRNGDSGENGTKPITSNHTVVERFLASPLARARDVAWMNQMSAAGPLSTRVNGGFPSAVEHAATDLRTAFLETVGLHPEFDLSQLHKQEAGNGGVPMISKDQLMYNLTVNYAPFQDVYDEFVRCVCIPQMLEDDTRWSAGPHRGDNWCRCDQEETVFYYQAFPCLRVIQPKEFSIGPHADIAYGHHPCCLNFYVPLTPLRDDKNTSTVFFESRPGSEDWCPILGEYGSMKRFAGGLCLHWTTDNQTDETRVTLDFRIIVGSIYDAETSIRHGVQDNYGSDYFVCCRKETNDGTWQRKDPLPKPNARMGFPWTVKDWGKLFCK
ncbi:hypothetical protein ACA910_004306 [Epithemia clementina (nom. ined.)]